MKIGETIKIKDENVDHVTSIKNEMDSFMVMAKMGAEGYKNSEKNYGILYMKQFQKQTG